MRSKDYYPEDSYTYTINLWARQDNIALEKSLSVKIEQLAEFAEEIKRLIKKNEDLCLFSEKSSKALEDLKSHASNLQYRLNARIKSSDEKGRKITDLREELWCLRRQLHRLREDARQQENKNSQEEKVTDFQEELHCLKDELHFWRCGVRQKENKHPQQKKATDLQEELLNSKTISGLRSELSALLRDKKDLLSTVSVLGENIKRLVRESDDLKVELQEKCEVIQRNIATHKDDKDKEGSLSLEVNHRLNAKIAALMHERVGLRKQNGKLASENSTLKAIIEICSPPEP